MTNKGKKLDSPFGLAMNPDEALARFLATKPEEVEESIKRSKAKGPPDERPPGAQDHKRKSGDS